MSTNYLEDKMSMELDLNKEQSKKLQKVTKHLVDFKKEYQRQSDYSLWYKKLFTEQTFSKTKAYDLIEEKQQIAVKMFRSLVPKVADFHSSLNKKQKKKFHELLLKYIESRK